MSESNKDKLVIEQMKDQLGNHPIVIKLLVILHIVASIFALVDIGLGGGIVGKSNIGRVPDNDNSGIGIFAIIHGCIFFFLLALPFLFYCVCITTTKETLTQTTIKSDDQTAACFLPCCNCLLLSIVAGGMFAYFGFGIFSLSDMFQYGGAYATSMGVITVFVLMFNLIVGIEATILLGGMLPDSCQLCCKAHRDYS